jgi:hypothetical protein
MKSLRVTSILFLALALSSCAPAGFVETTANVIDEMTAFKIARKANTKEAWQDFINHYPSSSKAKQARQWVQSMPDQGADQSRLQEELKRAERERAEQKHLAEAKAREEEARKAEQARLQEDQKRQQEASQKLLADQQAQQLSAQNSALLAELKKREEELNRREQELRKREEDLAKNQVATAAKPASDDVDIAPHGGLPSSEENFAIVIGIEKYRDIGANADYAERDARTMLLYLKDYLGFPEQNIKFLSADRATKSDIAKMLELWLPLQVTPDSKVFVFYSGHGAPDSDTHQAYILPYDGDPRALELTAYPLKRMYEKLGALPAKEIVVALDSCFSGAGGRSVIPQGARPLMTKIDSGKVSNGGKLTVFTAAAGEEITGGYEPQKHGLFTYYFLKGIRGDADANSDGWISVEEQYGYLKKNVSLMANRDSRQQTPQILPDLQPGQARASQKLAKVR